MGAVNGIRTVVYPARDMTASVESWTSTLGHGPRWESPDYVAFDAGGVEIGLSRLPWFDQALVFWNVDDIEAAQAELTAVGATALGEVEGGSMAAIGDGEVVTGDPKTGIVTIPGLRLAVVKATDGSLVGLAQVTEG
jgi:hypothetical protein